MTTILIILASVIALCVIVMAVVLYNFMLLLSELNKRQIYIISDILQSIDLSTPHLDSLEPQEGVNIEDVLEDATKEDNYFNPHEFDVEDFKENNS